MALIYVSHEYHVEHGHGKLRLKLRSDTRMDWSTVKYTLVSSKGVDLVLPRGKDPEVSLSMTVAFKLSEDQPMTLRALKVDRSLASGGETPIRLLPQDGYEESIVTRDDQATIDLSKVARPPQLVEYLRRRKFASSEAPKRKEHDDDTEDSSIEPPKRRHLDTDIILPAEELLALSKTVRQDWLDYVFRSYSRRLLTTADATTPHAVTMPSHDLAASIAAFMSDKLHYRTQVEKEVLYIWIKGEWEEVRKRI